MLETPLIIAVQKQHGGSLFISSNFDEQNKTQVLEKFFFQYMGFIATLNFQTFKVVLNPAHRFFLIYHKFYFILLIW